MTFRGAWTASASYKVGEAVSRMGSSYIALKANSSVDPSEDVAANGATWGLLAANGATIATGAPFLVCESWVQSSFFGKSGVSNAGAATACGCANTVQSTYIQGGYTIANGVTYPASCTISANMASGTNSCTAATPATTYTNGQGLYSVCCICN